MNEDLTQPNALPYVESNTTGATGGSESKFNDLLVCDVIDEFVGGIPKHVNDMPGVSSNGVTRNEMEWKHLTFLMAKEIIKLRKAN